MKRNQFLRGFMIGIVLIAAIILIGLFRDKILVPKIGDRAAYFIFALVIMVLNFVAGYFFVRGLKSKRRRNLFIFYRTDLLFVGIVWLALTVLCEFYLRRYIMGDTLSGAFAGYDAVKGLMFAIILFSQLAAPYLLGIFIL